MADTTKAPRNVFEPEPIAHKKLTIAITPQNIFFHILYEKIARTKNIGNTNAA